MTTRSKPARASDSPSRVSQTAPASKSVSSAVWDHLEAEAGFTEAIAEGNAQITNGQSVKLDEVRRSR